RGVIASGLNGLLLLLECVKDGTDAAPCSHEEESHRDGLSDARAQCSTDRRTCLDRSAGNGHERAAQRYADTNELLEEGDDADDDQATQVAGEARDRVGAAVGVDIEALDHAVDPAQAAFVHIADDPLEET